MDLDGAHGASWRRRTGSGRTPRSRPHSKWDLVCPPVSVPAFFSRIGMGLGGLLVIVFLMLGSGPKHEEGFLLFALLVPLVPLAVLSALLDPDPRVPAIAYPLMWTVASLGLWLEVASANQYPVFRAQVLGIVAAAGALSGVALYLIGTTGRAACRWVAGRLRMRAHA